VQGRWCGAFGIDNVVVVGEAALSSVVARRSMTHHVEAEAALSSFRSKLFQHKDVCYLHKKIRAGYTQRLVAVTEAVLVCWYYCLRSAILQSFW